MGIVSQLAVGALTAVGECVEYILPVRAAEDKRAAVRGLVVDERRLRAVGHDPVHVLNPADILSTRPSIGDKLSVEKRSAMPASAVGGGLRVCGRRRHRC